MMFPLLALVALLPLPLPLHSCQHRILSCKPETLIQVGLGDSFYSTRND